MQQRVFLSNSMDGEKLNSNSASALEFGKAHYSWKIVAALYEKGLLAAGYQARRIVRPEIYQDPIARAVMRIQYGDAHIAVKPIEHIRPFYGIKNIFICGWEFPEFSETPFGGDPLKNQIAMLRHADEIWCWSKFTAENLKPYGISNAVVMPPPALADRPADRGEVSDLATLALDTSKAALPSDVRSLGTVLSHYRGSKIFFTVFNPHDYRKQVPLMLAAFQVALKSNPDILLIVKLVIDNVAVTLGRIVDILKFQYNFSGTCDRIVFIGDSLSDGQMMTLMDLSDFYLSTASTEGLNLPLIEAMHRGLVPVCTNSTAMADYVSENNSVLLEFDHVMTEGRYHFLFDCLKTSHYPPRLSSVVKGVLDAAAMKKIEYDRLATRGRADVLERYSVEAFVRRLSAIGGI